MNVAPVIFLLLFSSLTISCNSFMLQGIVLIHEKRGLCGSIIDALFRTIRICIIGDNQYSLLSIGFGCTENKCSSQKGHILSLPIFLSTAAYEAERVLLLFRSTNFSSGMVLDWSRDNHFFMRFVIFKHKISLRKSK